MAICLIIDGINLKTNDYFVEHIVASNLFMLVHRYYNLSKDYFIKTWNMTTSEWESGSSHPVNAGADLHVVLEQITNQKI